MKFILIAVIWVLLLFGLYTVAFIIPKQLKEITEQLQAINESLKDINK